MVSDFASTNIPRHAQSLLGMFLWVRLVVEELKNCFSDWELESQANSLPKGLDEAYVLSQFGTIM